MIHCLVQQVHVIIIERGRYFVELFYGAVIEHFMVFYSKLS